MFTAHKSKEKIAEEILEKPRSSQDAFRNAIIRENGIEHSKSMKTNPFGPSSTMTATFKQEPKAYKQPRGKGGPNGYQNNQRSRGFSSGRKSFHRGS